MTFAFGALLIVILLLPGITFRYAYIRSNSIRRSLDFSLLSEAIIMLLLALILHGLGVWLAGLFGIEPDLRTLYLFATGGTLTDADFAYLEQGYGTFVLYSLLVCGLSGTLGYAAQNLVVNSALDERYKVLRTLNDWDRYFTGYALPPEARKKLNFIQVDLLVDGHPDNYVYSGVLINYSLNASQGIDQLFISDAIRRVNPGSGGNRDNAHQKYEMPGDVLAIPFSEVRNLNLNYHFMQEEPAPAPIAEA